LISRHAGLVSAVVAAHLTNPAEAEDVVQETFMVACREFRGLCRPESFGSWISTIARNLALAAAAAERRRRQQPDGWALEERAGSEPVPDRDALYRRILREVENLPEGCREVFLFRYVENKSCAEIAGELGVAIGTVTSRLSRGHQLLRERLARKDGT
jgi:RNA polymerase sigma-70 factor (ECF subfamily)